MSKKNQAAKLLGRLGGLAGKGKTSEKKAAASKVNGQLGGYWKQKRNLPKAKTSCRYATAEEGRAAIKRMVNKHRGVFEKLAQL